MSQVLRASLVRALRVTHAPVVNWFQLTEIANQYEREIPELVFIGIEASLRKEPTHSLLEAVVHACKKCATDKGDLIHDEQDDAPPLILQLSEALA